MPTFEVSEAFRRDVASLTPDQYARFQVAVRRFIKDLQAMEAGEQVRFRPGLRVNKVRGVGLLGRRFPQETWLDLACPFRCSLKRLDE